MAIVLMEKEKETGFLTTMRGSFILQQGSDVVDRIYLIKESEIEEMVHLFVTVPKEVEDWEYSAIFDEYNIDLFSELGVKTEEVEESYNPTWEVVFQYDVRHQVTERKINEIIAAHIKELQRVLEEIQNKKADYEE